MHLFQKSAIRQWPTEAKGDVLFSREISLKLICEKVRLSICDFCNSFRDYEYTYTYIISKTNLIIF